MQSSPEKQLYRLSTNIDKKYKIDEYSLLLTVPHDINDNDDEV
jgi:hypothetical protein